ncbi:MAG: NAD-dependent epimerase/dehydratase family protein, partial [Sandaracinaceae bacterium]|nr:NAD-dependent epimerase/dehydratase family protein [Sandaracinaceae bacterium]
MAQRPKAVRVRPERRVVAVTGADSFLGRNLIGLLEEDDSITRIVAIDVRRPRTAGRRTRFYEIDLAQPSVEARLGEILHAEEVDAIVHAAFLSSPTPAEAFAHELESVGTMNLLNAARTIPLRKLVLSSQTLLYGPHPSNPNHLTEEHPLRGLASCRFLADKIDAEREVARFAQSAPDCSVTVLRLAPLLGPTVQSWVSRWLSRSLVPTLLGFDPLVQLLHEMDAVAAFKLALDRRAPGTFNIVGDGVLPVSTLIKLAGRVAVPLPELVLRAAASLLWTVQLNEAPAAFVAFLRYVCVADGRAATRGLGFR